MHREGGYVKPAWVDVGESVPATLVDLLSQRADRFPGRPLFAFESAEFRPGMEAATPEDARGLHLLTYDQLDRQARAVAAWLQTRTSAGERALLLFPPGLEFLPAFFGCLLAGVVAVPVAPPRRNRPKARFADLVADAAPSVLITTQALLPSVRRWKDDVPTLAHVDWLSIEAVPDSLASSWEPPSLTPETTAFLQYTSGSTAAPKGVIVSHGNLIHNSLLIKRSFAADESSRGVFWLPLFHDMGLIGGVIQTLFCGGFSTLMSPVAFLQHPYRWLEAISRTGATISGAPNFAYDLCARKITSAQKSNLDLSRWTVAFNGAEPIRADTLDRFAEAFGSCGFRRDAFLPCYGLAESTLMVAAKCAGDSPRFLIVSTQELAAHRAVEVEETASDARRIAGSGRCFEALNVVVVDPKTQQPLAEQAVGEIWVSGESVAQGYWNQIEATRETFQAQLANGEGPYLRTGDLGFIAGDEIFVTGRSKDMIIVRGRNVYPHDIEWTVGKSHGALLPDAAAVFSIEVEGEERIVVVQEIDRSYRDDFAGVLDAIRTAVAEEHDLDVHAICLIRAGGIPRTSSGKIQRRVCREAYLVGALDVLGSRASTNVPQAALRADANDRLRSGRAIERWLTRHIAHTLGTDPDQIDTRRPFASFGLGSLQAIRLAGELEEWLGRNLAPTLVYDYPTIEALSRFLDERDVCAKSIAESVPTGWSGNGPEPVAIVGIGCRFPGANDPEEFWKLLSQGIDAISEPPPTRRSDGCAIGRRAGYLDRVDLFDAAFFGIAPREATCIDPQQRILLEVAWEALEDAGIAADRLRGRDVGVFVGVSTNDYGRHVGAIDSREAHALTGNALSIAANRLSYVFDFRGPSLAVDSACSSSLVAVHLACESLRRGEASLALAGGVNVLLSPEVTETFDAAGFLAPDGRCKAFDASADGYVRGEGAGVIVLKLLTHAEANGDSIHAVIRGSAVNQDGRSNGLTAPNREAQESVLRAAYARAGVQPGDIDYVEAHGTGTLLGDPIEAAALAAVLAEGRSPNQPCRVGSVKTNIGHLEAAAGIAGLVKTALALKHGRIPASLHFQTPNPHIRFEQLPIRIQNVEDAWPERDRPWLAGVSSFGFGGTNAHVVLESALHTRQTTEDSVELLLPLSAHHPQALRSLAERFADWLKREPQPPLIDISQTAARGRTHLDHRLAIVARTHEHAIKQIDAFLNDEASPGVSVGRRHPGKPPRCAFVFAGQEAAWPGMRLGRLVEAPIVSEVLGECDRRFQSMLGRSVVEALTSETLEVPDDGFVQPAMFSIQIALGALWRAWGIEPEAVVGSGLGEIAAAHFAGALDLDSATRIVAERTRLMGSNQGLGISVLVSLSEIEARRVIEHDSTRLEVAAVHGPGEIVISGDADAVSTLIRRLRDQGVSARRISGDSAILGRVLEPIRPQLRQALAGLTAQASTIPIVSALSGCTVPGIQLDAEYWCRQLQETAHLDRAIGRLVEQGFDTFIEIAPHPTFSTAIRAMSDSVTVVPSLQRGEEERERLLQSLGVLFTRGVSIDWSHVNPPGRRCKLPLYPFQRERFWIAPPAARRFGSSLGPHTNGHTERHALSSVEAHEIAWQSLDLHNSGVSQTEGSWLILEDARGFGPALRAQMESRGLQCFTLRPSADADLLACLSELTAQGPLAGIIDARALDWAGPPSPGALEAPLATARLASILEREPSFQSARLWLITAGAQAVADASVPLAVDQAMLWGLGRSFRARMRDRWGGLIDLDPTRPTADVATIARQLVRSSDDDEIVFREGRSYVPRLVPIKPTPQTTPSWRLRPEGTYLITGGLGALGLHVARRLVAEGARRLVLVSRRGLPERETWELWSDDSVIGQRIAAVRVLEEQGASILVAAVDVSDSKATAEFFTRLRREFPPLRGIIHAAGEIDEADAHEFDPEAFAARLTSKVAGTRILHEQSLKLPLDFFVMFSSVAAILGTRESAYCVANAFLDAFAHARRAQGLPALSINWGPWDGQGMAASESRARSFAALGISPLDPGEALSALGRHMVGDRPQVLVAQVDWSRLAQGVNHRLLDEIAPVSALNLATLDVPARSEIVRFVRNRLAAVLHSSSDVIDDDQPLDALGLDSIMAIELKNAVETRFGVSVPLSRLLEGPTIDQLAELLRKQSRASSVQQPVLEPVPSSENLLPVSIGQRALWSLHQQALQSAAYNMAGAVRIVAEIDVASFRAALRQVVDRHPMLRAAFSTKAGSPVMRIHDDANIALEFVDQPDAPINSILARFHEEANRPFDLERGPLFRSMLARRSANEYYWLLVMHHIVGDFWSIAVLVDELARAYSSIQAGRIPSLAPLPTTFAEHVRRENTRLTGEEGERAWAYWRQRLRPPIPTLNLPTDRPHSAIFTDRGAGRRLELEILLSSRLRELGQSRGASLFVTMLAGFQLWLSRITHQNDVIVGTPVAGRNRADLEGVVGYFVNTVPIRTEVDPDETFFDLIDRVRAHVLDALEHQDYPLALMSERLQAEARPKTARFSLFQVLFTLQKAARLDTHGLTPFVLAGAGAEMKLDGLEITSVPIEIDAAKFDLSVQVAEEANRLAIHAQYRSDLFDPDTIDRFLQSYASLLEAATRDPLRPIGDLPLLTTEDQKTLSSMASSSSEDVTSLKFAHQWIDEQAHRTADATAVVMGDLLIDYRSLIARADQLARRLQARGVGPECRVGLCLERSAEMVVAILATLKAGGAYVPLDPDYPAERLAYMVADANVSVLLTVDHIKTRLSQTSAAVLRLDVDEDWMEVPVATELATPAGLDHLAYMIYTSGSTGKPKGVLVSHRNLAHSTLARFQYYSDPVQRFLLVSSFAFDSSVAGLFWTLAQGGTLVLPDSRIAADPAALVSLIQTHRISHLLCVPSLYSLILDHEPDRLASLKTVIVAGEPCPNDLPARHARRLPATTLENEYGPTEATVWATVQRCSGENTLTGIVPIGRPIGATRAYVLDARLHLLPIGVVGELYLGGPALARGYHGRAGLTAERFLPDPFADQPGARMYRTGDLVRWRADGRLEYLGRTDTQVKIRGFRVELAGIEAALTEQVGVAQAVVSALPGPSGQPRLVGYVTPRVGETVPSPVELRRALRNWLPEPMIPSIIVVLEAFPLTPVGKIDRQALPIPSYETVSDERSTQPRSPIEQRLAVIWCEVLGLNEIGVHDDFFELGGHSLNAAQLMVRVRETFGVEVPVPELFDAPTIASLGVTLAAALSERSVAVRPPIQPVERGGLLPVSFAQQQLWLLDRLDPGRPWYNVPGAVLLEGTLDVSALERALAELVARHESLRTTFQDHAGTPVQRIHPPAPVQLRLEAASQEEAIERARKEAWQPFDLNRGPLFRCHLYEISNNLHLLCLTLHHIVADGWSVSILIRELGALYGAFIRNEPTNLPELQVQYADYASWQRAWLRDAAIERPLAFWREALAGVEPLRLPTDHPAPPTPTGRGGERTRILGSALTRGLRSLARTEGATLFMTLLAGFETLLYRYSGQTNFAIGSPVAGRDDLRTEGLIGFFINTLPHRADLSGEPGFRELIGRVKRFALAAFAHQELPFEQLVAAIRPDRSSSRTPVFQVMLVLQNTPTADIQPEGLTLRSVDIPNLAAKFDLTLSIRERDDTLRASLEYSADLFEPATADRLLAHFERLLLAAVADPDCSIDDLSLMSDMESETLVDQWNMSGLSSPAGEIDLDQLTDDDVDALIGQYLGEEGADE